MTQRIQALVLVVAMVSVASLFSASVQPSQDWTHFLVYLFAILLCSDMKIAMPKCNGTMSVNYPFILLSILQLSPLQASCLAAASALAQCLFRVVQRFSLLKILFNVANVATA